MLCVAKVLSGPCLSWVNLVVLTVGQPLPVCPMNGHLQSRSACLKGANNGQVLRCPQVPLQTTKNAAPSPRLSDPGRR